MLTGGSFPSPCNAATQSPEKSLATEKIFVDNCKLEMANKNLKIKVLKKDDRNANKGSDLGDKLLSNSFQRYGAGRSILADKDLNIIAGNHAYEKAIEAGITEIIVVPTDGTKLVVVQREDLDLNSKAGRELAIIDNRSAQAGIVFDNIVLNELSTEFSIDLDSLGIELPGADFGGPHFNDDDYDENDAADNSETSYGEGGGTTDAVENIFPLSIVMNKARKLGWEQFKKQHAFKNDQEAFDAIYTFAKQNYGL